MKRLLRAIPSLLVVGCVHRSPSTEAQLGCKGRQDVTVSNNWSESIDVFTRIGESPTQMFLGTVGAGRRDQFRLPDGARYALIQPTGVISTQPRMPASARSLVDLRYLCE